MVKTEPHEPVQQRLYDAEEIMDNSNSMLVSMDAEHYQESYDGLYEEPEYVGHEANGPGKILFFTGKSK